MALQPFFWALAHQWDSLGGESARRKAATYTLDNTINNK
jgi:hypothetical protein